MIGAVFGGCRDVAAPPEVEDDGGIEAERLHEKGDAAEASIWAEDGEAEAEDDDDDEEVDEEERAGGGGGEVVDRDAKVINIDEVIDDDKDDVMDDDMLSSD